VTTACEKLTKLRGRKLELEEQKRKARGELEQQASVVLTTYQQTINELLRKFGADFEITGTKPSFVGGRASSTYQLAINNVAIEIGDAKTPRGKPCFRTALSAGDKSTLALAFFIARLHQDAALGDKVVVFDDPLSSLDCFRVACTQQEIRRIAAQAQQVVVLSHEAFFLKGIHDCAASPSTTKTLQFTRKGKTRTLEEWKIKEYFLHEAHRDFFLLRTFLDNGLSPDGDLVNVARSIRPYLEGHLRYRYPDEYGPTECLGDFTDRIRKAVPPSSLARLQAKADELTALNEYARRFHHPGQVSPPVTTTETELRAYIHRTLAFAQGA
jgi:wobble nucleotide-excising tRNase